MKIFVGLSGGVDSSVSALLLQKQGFQVEGLFMKNWEEDDTENYCSAAQDKEDAQQVCDQLNIPLHTINFSAEYWEAVFENFLSEYQAGRTPNPDILCNKEIKFKAFLNYALTQGAEKIATGHYARCQETSPNHYQLLKGLDKNKDQSYFLYTLNSYQLSKSLFPLGELTKPEVRKIAEAAGFKNHQKKDSTGICFIGEKKFKEFLSRYLLAKPGLIKTPEGKTLGEHQGLIYYTLGQRKGLALGGQKSYAEKPWYVAQKKIDSNELIVVQDPQNPLLLSNRLIFEPLANNEITFAEKFSAMAKIRYRSADHACSVKKINSKSYEVIFDQAQWAVTPGQSIVFYQNDVCLGGGIIQE